MNQYSLGINDGPPEIALPRISQGFFVWSEKRLTMIESIVDYIPSVMYKFSCVYGFRDLNINAIKKS